MKSSASSRVTAAVVTSGGRFSKITLSGLVERIFSGTPRKGQDIQCRVFVGSTGEAARVGNKKVLHIVRLAKAAQNRSLAIGSHANGAYFVRNATWREMAKVGMR